MKKLSGLLFALAALNVAASAAGQEPQPAAPDSAVQILGPVAIAPTRVLARSDSLDMLLEAAEAALESDGRIAAVDSAVESSSGTIAELSGRGDDINLRTASFRVFDDLRNRWRLLSDDLRDWQAVADARSLEIGDVEEELEREWLDWSATRDSAVQNGYPELLRGQIDSALARIDDARTRTRAGLDSVLTVARRVSALQAQAREAGDVLEETEALRRQQLLTPEHPALWRAFGESTDTTSLAASLRTAWEGDWDVLVAFVSQEQDLLLFRLVLFVLIAVGLTLIHTRLRPEVGGDAELESALALLARPLSAAFLLFLLSGRLLHPSMPQVYRDLNALLLMVPLARMVPVLVPPVTRPAAYGLIGLFTVLEVESFFVWPLLTERLVTVAENVVVLMGLAWFGRSEGGRALARGRWETVLRSYLRVGLALLGGSLLANVFGLTDLAELVTWGVVVGLVAAFLATAAVIVLRATFRVVLRQPFAQASVAVRHAPGVIARRFDRVLTFAFGVWWLVFMLGIFRIRDVVFGWATAIVGASLTLGSIDVSLGDILAFLFVIWAAFQISRFVRFVLAEDVLPRVHLPRGVPRTITTLTNYVVLGLGFLFAAAAAGIDLSQITLLVGAFGVGIGLGLQSIVNNFVSGLVLLFERPIQVGDTIQVDSILGTAERIGIRSSVVRTFDGAEFIVPNADLVSGRVINWSLSDRRRRLELDVGVAYGTDPEKALEILLRVAGEHEGVLSDPAPAARFVAFGDSSLDLRLLAWSTLDDWLDVASDLHVRVNTALLDEGIEIPFPQRDLHVRSVDDSAGQALATDGRSVASFDASQPRG